MEIISLIWLPWEYGEQTKYPSNTQVNQSCLTLTNDSIIDHPRAKMTRSFSFCVRLMKHYARL